MITFLSHMLNNQTPAYGNSQTDLVIKVNSSIEEGANNNSLRIEMSNHVGTHIDLPAHFDKNGKRLNDYSDSDWVFNKVQLIDIPKKECEFFSFSELESVIDEKTEVLLLRTGFEKLRQTDSYWKSNPGFLEEVGFNLRKSFPTLKVLGFDFISITSYSDRPLGRKAHRSFLSSEFEGEALRVIEDMKLAHLEKAPSKITIAPLMIDNADGVQVTVIAEVEDQ